MLRSRRPVLTRLADRARRHSNRVVVFPNGTRASLVVFGWIDDATAELIQMSVHDLLEGGMDEIRLDLGNTSHIDPAGIERFRHALSMANGSGHRTVVTAISETVALQMRRAGMVGCFELEEPFAS